LWGAPLLYVERLGGRGAEYKKRTNELNYREEKKVRCELVRWEKQKFSARNCKPKGLLLMNSRRGQPNNLKTKHLILGEREGYLTLRLWSRAKSDSSMQKTEHGRTEEG